MVSENHKQRKSPQYSKGTFKSFKIEFPYGFIEFGLKIIIITINA